MSDEADRVDVPSPDRITALWRRLKDHRIAQWAVGYVAVAYGIQHAVTLTSEAFKWPDAVIRISMLLLVLGLPVAMTIAWYHGERASRRISGPELTIISLLLVAISILFFIFVRPSAEIAGSSSGVQQASATGAPETTATRQSGVAAARSVSLSPATAISLAVLPFSDLSSDANQGYFSDGMTEEITTALAKIPDLGVVARESAFAFKGKDQDVRSIGKALSATHLIEGSVRKAGDQLRISVQLVRAADGRTLWANSYDRELKDVFAVQEDIARSIATSLNMQLGLSPGENLVSDRAIDPESYQQYLRARALFRARSVDQAVSVLEGVVARDPNYAPAWALLPRAYQFAQAYNAVSFRKGSIEDQHRAFLDATDKINKAAREAVRLDPRLPGGYLGLALVEFRRRNHVAAERLWRQALALDPNDPDTLDAVSQRLFAAGYLKESLRLREQLQLLEPFVPIYEVTTAEYMRAVGRTEAAIQLLEKAPADGQVGERRAIALAMAYADKGQYDKAADALLAIPADQNRTSREQAAVAAQLLRQAPGKISGNLPALQGSLTFVYEHVGARDRILDQPETGIEEGLLAGGLLEQLWDPPNAPLRKTGRFKALVRKAGLADLWRARGWPDLCHPVGTDDFACN